MIQRRETPPRLGSSPIDPQNFVASTTSSRRPFKALPTIFSDSPAEYTSAVSTKLIPASSARWMMRIDSSWSALPQAPNIIAPRQRGLTLTPVCPSVRLVMAPDDNADGLRRWAHGPGRAARVAGGLRADLARRRRGRARHAVRRRRDVPHRAVRRALSRPRRDRSDVARRGGRRLHGRLRRRRRRRRRWRRARRRALHGAPAPALPRPVDRPPRRGRALRGLRGVALLAAGHAGRLRRRDDLAAGGRPEARLV